jgi:hypothetical protein
MARMRSTLALCFGTLTCFAFAQGTAHAGKGKPKPKAGDKGSTKPIDLDAPITGDEPKADAPGAGSGSAGAAVEMTDDDKPSADPTGTRENPNAPKVGGDDENTEVRTGAPPPRRTGYPIEEVLRPITLPANTSEVALDLRTVFEHADAEAELRARYGITRQVQIGLLYDIGGVFADTAAMTSTKFNTGKAAGLEGSYLVTDWAAVHVRVPVYMQPFAMGLTLGAPMKFRFADNFAVVALDNVVDITLHNFVPSFTSEAQNRANAFDIGRNNVKHDGNLRFIGGAVYQIDPKTAVFGTLGVEFPDFSGTATYPLEGVVQYSPSAKFDIAGRAGFDSLGDATKTFGIRLSAAFRI